MRFFLWKSLLCQIFLLLLQYKTTRDGAVVARWAHNPKVVGSSPAPATKRALFILKRALYLYSYV